MAQDFSLNIKVAEAFCQGGALEIILKALSILNPALAGQREPDDPKSSETRVFGDGKI